MSEAPRSLLTLESAGPAALRIRWSISAAAWARLDAEFPGSAGATERLADPAAARSGAVEVALAEDGDYEAELGLASADGGWLVLMRSARRRWSRAAGVAAVPEMGAALEGDPPEPPSVPTAPSAPAAEASSYYPSVWGLLPDDLGEAALAAEPLPRPPAGAADGAPPVLPPRWGEGPAAAGYAAVPGGPSGVQVCAELIVHGSAPPGTLVDLYGRAFRVGPGGAFSLRFDLADPELLRRILAEAPQIAPAPATEPEDRG